MSEKNLIRSFKPDITAYLSPSLPSPLQSKPPERLPRQSSSLRCGVFNMDHSSQLSRCSCPDLIRSPHVVGYFRCLSHCPPMSTIGEQRESSSDIRIIWCHTNIQTVLSSSRQEFYVNCEKNKGTSFFLSKEILCLVAKK